MLPYFHIPALPLFGPFAIQPFGLLVVTGILVGNWLAHRRAREAGIPEAEISGAVVWAVGMGFVGAHLVDLFFYHPERLADDGWTVIFKIWQGISSFGGFLGALVGMSIYFWRLHKPWLKHADIIVQALVAGWVFGRLGCTIAFDHPGVITTFPLAFHFADGTVRHNLGFYEFLYTLFFLLPAMLWLHKRKPPTGAYVAWASMLYAPVRFFLDALRAQDVSGADARYFGLTPAQYGAIALFAFGAWMWRRSYRKRAPSRH